MQNILLAAGLGSRSDGKKLLLPYQGETLVHHAVRESLLAGLYTVVVTGFKTEEVNDAIKDLHCEKLCIVHNPDYLQGQGSSTRCGANHLKEGEHFFISLSDMPLIEARHYHLLSHFCAYDAVRPSCNGRLGHPVLLAPRFLSVIRNQKDPFTMRSLLASYEVHAIDVNERAYILDIDTMEEYQALLSSTQPREDRPS